MFMLLFAFGAATDNLLANAGFEDGLDGWTADVQTAEIAVVEEEERRVAMIATPDSDAKYPMLYQDFSVAPETVVEAGVELLGRNIRGGYGAYLALVFLDSVGERIETHQPFSGSLDNRWTRTRFKATAPPGTNRVRLCLVIHGQGWAYFDNALLRLHPTQPPQHGHSPVTLSVTDETSCKALLGIGGQDNGWFYNRYNREAGVTQADYSLNETRLRWLAPDVVRMFIWSRYWCPSANWETFVWDDPDMQSIYRTLQLYQEIGSHVNITSTFWRYAPRVFIDPPEPLVHALGELMEHLIRDRGFDCIRYYTLCNEPNGWFTWLGGTIESYGRLYALLKNEFPARGLSVQLVASDDAQSIHWFRKCVHNEELYTAADVFSSHRYFRPHEMSLAPHFFEDRLELLETKAQTKPLFIGEFGFHGEGSGIDTNPVMLDYDYAVNTAAFLIDGLNRGVAGFSIWTLHEVKYLNGTMRYGLWGHKDVNWAVRPVYHALAMFTRHTAPGDAVRVCKSTDPTRFRAVLVNETLFWVNLSDDKEDIALTGWTGDHVRIMNEETLHGDRDSGDALSLASDSTFEAPPRSFGYAR
jgi:hypothetical protein